MAELPHDARRALVAARVRYTPSPQRVSRLQQRIQAAVLAGAAPSVPSELAHAQRIVGLEGPSLWHARLLNAGIGIATLGMLALCLVLFARPPAGVLERGGSKSPSADPTAPVAATVHEEQTDPGVVPAHSHVEAARAAVPQVVPSPIEENPKVVELALPRRRDERPRPSAPAPARSTSSVHGQFVHPTVELDSAPSTATDSSSRTAVMASTPAQAGDEVRAKPDSGLSQEVALIAAARGALDRGEVARAASLLRDHVQRFPAGQLVSERLALEVRVHCALGEGAAARKALEELSLWAPNSALRRTLERACGDMLSP
ncbi:MAG: hypothetical protein QM778_30470 [Myxococcales bacterium]